VRDDEPAGTGDAAAREAAGTTIGVTGRPWRMSVAPWGAVTPWAAPVDGRPASLEWHVAADDRWHVPATEPTLRQQRIDGTPVVETRLRVPDGDVVQRVWAVADRGGLTVIEFENESPLPVAVAVSGLPVVTERPPSGVPARGIDLPADAVVLPVGHRSTVRVALPDGDPPPRTALAHLPPAATVVRGWTAVVERASRLGLPDPALVRAVVAARCDLWLDGPVDPASDPAGHVLDVAELVRMGDEAGRWLPHLVEPVASMARRPGVDVDAALVALERLARAAGDDRAARDAARIVRTRRRRGLASAERDEPLSFAELRRGGHAGRFVRRVERLLVADGEILRAGVPSAWLGTDFEVHGVPTGPDSTLSYAVRWHGPRPAILWEQQGETIPLSAPVMAPGWSSPDRRGEALWPAPRRPTTVPVSADRSGRT
jgi:hypothetical protein